MQKAYISKFKRMLKVLSAAVLLITAVGSFNFAAFYGAESRAFSNSAPVLNIEDAFLDLSKPAELTDTLVGSATVAATQKTESIAKSTAPFVNTDSSNSDNTSNPVLTPIQKVGSSIANFSAPLPIKTGNKIKGMLASKSDNMVYSLEISQRGYIVLELSHSLPSAPANAWNAVLYEEYNSTGIGGEIKYRPLGRVSSTLKDTDVATSEKIGVYPGNYIIVVSSGTAFSPTEFYIKADFTATFDYEAGYNDTITRYNEITLNKPIKGVMNEGEQPDSDWFMFRVDKKGFVRISFEHEDLKLPQVGWKIYLYDQWENELYYAKSNFNDTLVRSGLIGLDEGYYFVNISQHIHSEAEYTLTVSFEQSNLAESEYNDSIETAMPIETGKQYKGSISERSRRTDKDFFKVTLPMDGSVALLFEKEPINDQKDGWNITLINKDGEVMYSAVAKLSTAKIESPRIGLAAGEYYVVIDSENRTLNTAPYTISLDFDATYYWEAEKNDTMAKANPISVNRDYRGSLVEIGIDFDTDWYSFELTGESRVSVRFSHNEIEPNLNKGWLIQLVDKDGRVIKSVTSRWGDAVVSTEEAVLPAGKYYVKVDTAEYYNSATYILKLEVNAR